MSEDRITLELTRAEALVFFEWLARVDAAERSPVEDPSEQQVLWTLEAQIEKLLVEPLEPNYQEILDHARQEVLAGRTVPSRMPTT